MESSKSCCLILQNPEKITEKQGKARARFIHMHLLGARQVDHYDCFEAILALNGDINYFSDVKGKKFRQDIKEVLDDYDGVLSKNHPKCPDSDLFKILVKYGLNVSDLIEDMMEFYVNESSDQTEYSPNPIDIMNDHATGSLAILLQKEYASLSQDSSRRVHRKVVYQAVKKADEKLVNRLVDAGTNKQELLAQIQYHKDNQNLTEVQAQRLTKIANKTLSLKEKARLTVWSSMPQLKDVMNLPGPIGVKRNLLFEEEESSGFPVTKRLKAEMP